MSKITLKCNPHDGMRITSKYGPRYADPGWKFHSGIDIGATKPGVIGDVIYAVDNGYVRRTAYDNSGYGNYLVIEHDTIFTSPYCTLYGHLAQIEVSTNQYVYAGQRIGTMGNTGHSSAAHLHFEIRDCGYDVFWQKMAWQNSTKPKYSVDPQSYLLVTESNTKTRENPTTEDQVNNYNELPNFPYTDYGVDRKSIKSYDKQFGRRYKIIVTDDIGKSYDVSDLHCIFEVKKKWVDAFENISTVTLYNLEPDTENNIILHGNTIIIEAGYEGDHYGVIFNGKIVQTIRRKENGTDYVLELYVVDSDQYLNSNLISLPIQKGQTMRSALEIVSKNAKYPIQITSISEDYSNQKYTRGKVIFGKTNDYIEQLAKSKDAMAFYNNGTLSLTRVTDTPSGEIIRLNYDSGMIGAPTQTEYGIDVRALLNPQLKVNTLIQVEKENIVERQYSIGSPVYNQIDVDGVYRIIEVTYTGDTRGDDWYCDLVTVVQSGAIPNIMYASNYSI